MENILLFDGNNLLHRSFHGIQNMSTSEGKPTNAIFGLLNTILKYLDMYQPKCIAVAFDNKSPNFRRLKFPYYKATRNPIDPASNPSISIGLNPSNRTHSLASSN